MLVVDGGVETEILGDPCAFVVAAGDANDAAAVNPSNLPDDAAGGASGGGDDERVTFFRLGDLHPEKRSESVDAEHAEEYGVRDERDLRHFVEGALGGFIEDDVLLKARETCDAVSLFVIRVARLDDFGEAESAHDFTDGHCRDVG